MVDTIRTIAALQALLADNTAGDISAQDARDTLVSTYDGSTLIEHVTPPSAGWSWVNQGSATVSTASTGALSFALPAVGANNLTAYVRTHASSDIHTAHINALGFGANGGCGLCFRESSTGELTIFYQKPGLAGIIVENWTSPTVFSSTLSSVAYPVYRDVWMRLEDNGTNLLYSISYDGANFLQQLSMGRTSFMAGGPDQVGFICRDNSGAWRADVLYWATV